MLSYLIRRVLLALFTCWAISVLAFAIIQLPPGDFVDAYIANLSASGSGISADQAQQLRAEYALDEPIYVQYMRWMRLMARGDLGMAMEWQRPVTEVIGDRLWLTMVVSIAAVAADLDRRPADRYLLRRAALLAAGLPVHAARLPGAGDPGLPARSAGAVLWVRLLQRQHRRAVLACLMSTRPGAGRRWWTCSSTCRCRQ